MILKLFLTCVHESQILFSIFSFFQSFSLCLNGIIHRLLGQYSFYLSCFCISKNGCPKCVLIGWLTNPNPFSTHSNTCQEGTTIIFMPELLSWAWSCTMSCKIEWLDAKYADLSSKNQVLFFYDFYDFFLFFIFLFFKEHMPTNCKYYYHNTASTPQFQCTELDTFRLRKCRTIKLGAFPRSTYIVQ